MTMFDGCFADSTSASKMTYIVSGGALNSTHSPCWLYCMGGPNTVCHCRIIL